MNREVFKLMNDESQSYQNDEYSEQELTKKFKPSERELNPRQAMIVLNGLKKKENDPDTYVNVRRTLRNLPMIVIEGTKISLNGQSFTIDKNRPAQSTIDGLQQIGFEFY